MVTFHLNMEEGRLLNTVFPRKDVAATIYFSRNAMRRLFEGGYYSNYRRHGYYLHGYYIFISALQQCGDYWRAAFIRGNMVCSIFLTIQGPPYFNARCQEEIISQEKGFVYN